MQSGRLMPSPMKVKISAIAGSASPSAAAFKAFRENSIAVKQPLIKFADDLKPLMRKTSTSHTDNVQPSR